MSKDNNGVRIISGYRIILFFGTGILFNPPINVSGFFHFLNSILLSFFQPSFLNYFISLIFLGIGWNFLFISGTSLLVTTYKPEEKFKAQGFNDLLVFSSMALASLLAGILISIASWKTVNLFCIPFLILIILSIVNADKKR